MEIKEALETFDDRLSDCPDDIIYNEAWQTLKSAVLEQRSDNIGSPKLPLLMEVNADLWEREGMLGIVQCNMIRGWARQLRAGA